MIKDTKKVSKRKAFLEFEMENSRDEFNRIKPYINILIAHECILCKSKENLQFHHILPLAKGGTNEITNILRLCNQCHYKVHEGKYPMILNVTSKYKNISIKDIDSLTPREIFSLHRVITVMKKNTNK